MEFLSFWFNCLLEGWSIASNIFSLIETCCAIVVVILIWHRLHKEKVGELEKTFLIAAVFCFVTSLVVATLFISPFHAHAKIKQELLNEKKLNSSSPLYAKITSLVAMHKGDLIAFCESNGIAPFFLELDDALDNGYWLGTTVIENPSRSPIPPFELEISAGGDGVCIIGFQSKTISPKFKEITIKTDLPLGRWKPANECNVQTYWSQNLACNVYLSLFSDCGFGQINSSPISDNNIGLWFAFNTFPQQYFLKIGSLTGGDELLRPEVFPINNPSYTYGTVSSEPQSVVTPNFTAGNTTRPKDLTLMFPYGIEGEGRIETYLVGKAVSGASISPRLRVKNSPTIRLTGLSSTNLLDIKIPPHEGFFDPTRKALTPLMVRSIPVFNCVVLYWEPSINKAYDGVFIYKSAKRSIGDYDDPGQLIYEGKGFVGELIIKDENNENSLFKVIKDPIAVPKVPFQAPLVKSNLHHAPPSPSALKFSTKYSLFRNYYLDTNVIQGEFYTYTVYGYDSHRHASYPVLVQSGLDLAAQKRTMTIKR